jgi:hypothetical protein
VKSIRSAISAQHGLALSTVCLLKTRSIPKTTSGKIARAWCRRGFVENTLQVVFRSDSDSKEEVEFYEGDRNLIADATSPGVDHSAYKKSGGGSYSKIHSEDVHDPISGGGTNIESTGLELTTTGPRAGMTAEQVRALSVEELLTQLEFHLLEIVSHGSGSLTSPVNTDVAISTMGLDSQSLVQFKGVLDRRCELNNIKILIRIIIC